MLRTDPDSFEVNFRTNAGATAQRRKAEYRTIMDTAHTSWGSPAARPPKIYPAAQLSCAVFDTRLFTRQNELTPNHVNESENKSPAPTPRPAWPTGTCHIRG